MSNYPLFSVIGIEIEYMLVDKDSLEVSPKSDLILKELGGGRFVNEVSLDNICVSNELVLHVLELKNNGPKPANSQIGNDFQKAIQQLQPLLDKHNLQFLPTGAHPWMEPLRETKRWPHGNNEIYQQFSKIFDCNGHGFANLQSMHVNLPFNGDEEFAELHNAIRLILPLLPAISASTPFIDGKTTGYKSSRLDFYGKNQARIPSISGEIIPEFVSTKAQYEDLILTPMYNDISPYDKQGLLQYEWLNSRAAIAKFDVQAIEIRIIDSQECVQADISIALLIRHVLEYLVLNAEIYLKNPLEIKRLKNIYLQTIKEGFGVMVDDSYFLDQLQLPKRLMSVTTIWELLIEKVSTSLDYKSQTILEQILKHGNLSDRLLKAAGQSVNKPNLLAIYRRLGDCLVSNELFIE